MALGVMATCGTGPTGSGDAQSGQLSEGRQASSVGRRRSNFEARPDPADVGKLRPHSKYRRRVITLGVLMRGWLGTLGNDVDMDSGRRFSLLALHTEPVDQRSRTTKDPFDFAIRRICEPVTGRTGDQRLLIRKAPRGTRPGFGRDHHHVEVGARQLDFPHDYVLLLRAHGANAKD